MLSDIIYRGHALRIAAGITILVLSLTGSAYAATLTVNASGGADYTRIQDAIDNSNNGDTILVESGTYFENVDVSKQLILKGIDTGGKPVVNANGSGSAITLSAGNSTLEGFTLINASVTFVYNVGIRITSSNNIIMNNALHNNFYGIYLGSSSNGPSNNNTLSNNNVSNNMNTGIVLYYSSNNTLSNNNASNNQGAGIVLGSSSNGPSNNNTLSYNNASNNMGAGIALDSSRNNTLNNNNALHNNFYGISLKDSSNNNLSGNNASENPNGIYLGSSSNNILSNNNASNNGGGIYLEYSSNNTLSNNNASNNNNHGIYLDRSSSNKLSNNNALNNYQYGIVLDHSRNNTISDNNVSSNNHQGIALSSSSKNYIYNNYLYSSNIFPIDNANYNNSWSTAKKAGTNIVNGPYLGGNFWANSSGTGYSQTCTDANRDGICDLAYVLDANNSDYLPLSMNFKSDSIASASVTKLIIFGLMLVIGIIAVMHLGIKKK